MRWPVAWVQQHISYDELVRRQALRMIKADEQQEYLESLKTR